ncbi:PucR family transcriptional regulator [Blautia sp. MCC269]|uniref:PucR family transcriptional regulator n=1 Tax=Blautia sp. MCC269 TaxID=2592638 RepID=UPI001C0225AD|nr:PucR family transcriptional regulator [Blautia sp. MCC269]MBT9803549.1 PucR family transcriptional regulator [Blautia sp. MCC269]
MAYTVKKLLESNQFPDMKLVAGEKSLNQEIKGIQIIEIEDMERCLSGGELLLTSMKVYFGETARVFRKHLEKLEKKQISGFIIKRHPEIVQKVDYYTILLKFCSEREIPVIEIPEIEYYWGIIKYVILQIYDENIAWLIYFKLTHDNISNILLNGKNFEDTMKSILFLLSSMIGNPVALYYSNLTCCASTTQDLSDFVFEKNVEKYKPNIITRFEYQKQTKEHTQYITTINVLGRAEVYLVVTEMNMPLTVLDYMALENAVLTLKYSFMESYAQNEIDKKYQRDVGYSLLNGLLTGDELNKAAHMLKLKEAAQYCVVSFHTISNNSEDYYTKEELEEIGVIEGEIQRLLPDEHIYRNRNQIVCIHEIKPGETQAGFREEMEKLYDTIQKQIIHRNKTTDFQIGIGSIVNGYGDLKKSFKDSKKIIDYMDMLRYLYGDKNISVADFSKLGFFQIFEKIKNRDELMEYVPESLVKLYWYDKEHDGELIETLQAYLDCDKSANKAAEKLYVNYRTLSGRLKKIKDISGIDFKNSAEMLAVRNGIVLFKMAETL